VRTSTLYNNSRRTVCVTRQCMSAPCVCIDTCHSCFPQVTLITVLMPFHRIQSASALLPQAASVATLGESFVTHMTDLHNVSCVSCDAAVRRPLLRYLCLFVCVVGAPCACIAEVQLQVRKQGKQCIACCCVRLHALFCTLDQS
jgi:hypothetical protein